MNNFDGYDTSKESVSMQLAYLGSYLSADLKQPRLKGSLSLGKQSKRPEFYRHRKGALPSEVEFNTLSSFPKDQQSNILPVLDRSDVRFDKMVSRDRQPIREKLWREQKKVDLDYDLNLSLITKKTVVNVPSFKKTMPRGAKIPGMSSGMVDPTGHGFIDESTTGLEGQGFGLASYKKGLQNVSTCDILKANQSEMELKEHRKYNQLPFRKILGRSQVDLKGRRTDLGLTANSMTRYDLKDIDSVDSVSFAEYLPNSVQKSESK